VLTSARSAVRGSALLAVRRHYTLIIGALLGKQLIRQVPGRTLEVIATPTGRSTATELAGAPEWTRTNKRAEFLHERLDIPAARLDQLLRPAIRRMETELLKDTA
jgi:hypothetical protein